MQILLTGLKKMSSNRIAIDRSVMEMDIEIKDLVIGQNITANYWFKHEGYAECATITGTVTRKLTDFAEIDVENSFPEWFNGRSVWIDRKTEILSINNQKGAEL